MNTAARIQSAAPENGVLVDEETHRATAHAIDYRPVEAGGGEGARPSRCRFWEAVDIRTQPGRRAPSQVPFVGRTRELELLADLWDEGDRRQMASPMHGDRLAGVGKSRLLTEFEERVSRTTPACTAPAAFRTARGSPTGP